MEAEFAQAQQEFADAEKAHTRELQQKEGELLGLKEKYERESVSDQQLEQMKESRCG